MLSSQRSASLSLVMRSPRLRTPRSFHAAAADTKALIDGHGDAERVRGSEIVKPAMVSPVGAFNQRNTNIKLAQRFDKRFAGVGVFTCRPRR